MGRYDGEGWGWTTRQGKCNGQWGVGVFVVCVGGEGEEAGLKLVFINR